MSSTIGFFLVACICLLLASARKFDANERTSLIESAIQEVKQENAVKSKNKLSSTHQKLHAFKMATPEALAQGKAALLFENMVKRAEKKIIQKERQSIANTKEALAESLAVELLHKPGSILTKQEIAKIYQESECGEAVLAPPNCKEPRQRKHRTADGTCNNREHPTRGAANTEMRRLIHARYEDGISRPRGFLQSQRSDLFISPFSPPAPSPRVASLGVIRDRLLNDTDHTLMLMQWGQFMDHDLDAIPEHEDCPEGCEIEEEGSCFPFPVPLDDADVLATRNVGDENACHQFRRSLSVCEPEGPLTEVHAREQINAITHFIDASNVYHHNEDIQRNLIRDTSSGSGLLKVGPPAQGTTQASLPDFDINANRGVIACPNPSPPCFLAGDFRVNEQTSLTTMHTIWLREHNRVAGLIKDINPSFDDETIFLHARDIVASEIQKITYKDYLPIILGEQYSNLIPDFTLLGYDPEIDPNIPNAFATAAYRFGHSQVQPVFERLDEHYQSIPAGPLNLVDAFFDTSHFRNDGGTDPIIRGLLQASARKVDEFLNNILTNQLFASDATTPGLDLAALNIQRGRDHGLPTYFTWKEWAKEECGVESDFQNELTEIRLLQAYGDLDNVDLFVGGLAESPLPGGALVGAVFACIFSKTFTSARNGDRFFYENPDPDTAIYTPAEIAEIEKTSLSRVICDNTDITEIQPNAFLSEDRVSCSNIPSMDLSVFYPTVTLPDFCYLKVSSTGSFGYAAVSSRSPIIDYRFHYHREGIRANTATCFPVLCPEVGGRRAAVDLFPLSPFTGCEAKENINLGLSLSFLHDTYFQFFPDDEVLPRNGLYSSLESCIAGTAVAVEFICNAFLAREQQDDTDTSTIDTDSNSVEELEEIVGEDGRERVEEFISNLPGSAVSSKESNSEDKLISLMENVLAKLQNNKNKEEHGKKMEMTKKRGNKQLLSELEEALKTME